MSFELDARLAGASHLAGRQGDIQLRIADDARYLWLMLIPEQDGVCELHDLSEDSQQRLMQLAIRLGGWLKHRVGADKINTAAIGNVVVQLHLHVVCRTEQDACWPAPIWGNGDPVPMDAAMLAERCALITTFLEETSPA